VIACVVKVARISRWSSASSAESVESLGLPRLGGSACRCTVAPEHTGAPRRNYKTQGPVPFLEKRDRSDLVSSGRQFGRTVGLSGGADHRCRVRARDGECLDTAVVMASAGCSGSESRPAAAWTSLHVTSPAVSGVDDTAWVHILLAAIQHRNFGGEGYSTHR